jgi:hypothetical protein
VYVCYIEKAGTSASFSVGIEAVDGGGHGGSILKSEKILLGMTGDLSWGSCGDIVFRDALPVTLTQLFNTF